MSNSCRPIKGIESTLKFPEPVRAVNGCVIKPGCMPVLHPSRRGRAESPWPPAAAYVPPYKQTQISISAVAATAREASLSIEDAMFVCYPMQVVTSPRY